MMLIISWRVRSKLSNKSCPRSLGGPRESIPYAKQRMAVCHSRWRKERDREKERGTRDTRSTAKREKSPFDSGKKAAISWSTTKEALEKLISVPAGRERARRKR